MPQKKVKGYLLYYQEAAPHATGRLAHGAHSALQGLLYSFPNRLIGLRV